MRPDSIRRHAGSVLRPRRTPEQQSRNAWILLVCFPCLMLSHGCSSGPKSVSAADLRNESVRRRVASEFWIRQDLPKVRRSRNPRVAITEFTVEFVTERLVTPTDGGPLTDSPIVSPLAEGIGLTGLAKANYTFSDELKREVTDMIYAQFCGLLLQRDFQVLERSEVSGAMAYGQFVLAEEQTVRSLDPLAAGSDTGRVKAIELQPVSGLAVIDRAEGEALEAVEAKLINELNADVSLRVRIRIGVHHDRATLERGSIVSVVGSDFIGSVAAIQSITSDTPVVCERRFLPVEGETSTVDDIDFLIAMQETFPLWMMMAFERGDAI